jgi:hypothetical protein
MDREKAIRASAAALAKGASRMALTRKRVLKETGRAKAELGRKGVKVTTQELFSRVPEKTKLYRFLADNGLVRKEEVSLEAMLAFIAVLLLQLQRLLAGYEKKERRRGKKKKKKRKRK